MGGAISSVELVGTGSDCFPVAQVGGARRSGSVGK